MPVVIENEKDDDNYIDYYQLIPIESSTTSNETGDKNKQSTKFYTIGKGVFSTIVKAKHSLINASVAMKIVSTSSILNGKLRLQLAHNEAILLARLRHVNIARLYQSFRIEWNLITGGAAALLVLEVVDGKRLDQFIQENIGNLPMHDFSVRMVGQLVSAVSHIHSRGIVHRDLHPRNCLLTKSERNPLLKLIGFDTATLDRPSFLPPLTITKYNRPPLDEPNTRSRSLESIDIWSIGCITHFILIGTPPLLLSESVSSFNWVMSGVNEKEFSFMRHALEFKSADRANIYDLEEHALIKDYQKPSKKHIPTGYKKCVIEEISTILNIPVKNLTKLCHEQRFDEISAMYNLMLDNSNLNQNSITSTTTCKNSTEWAVQTSTKFSSNGPTPHANTGKQQSLSPAKPPSLQPSVPRNPRRRLYSRVDRVKSAPPTGVRGSYIAQGPFSGVAYPASVSDSVSAKNNNNTENTKEASEFENTQGSLHREQHDVVGLDIELNDSLNRRVDAINSGFLLDDEVINEFNNVLNQDSESELNEHSKEPITDQKQNNHISPNFKPQSPNKSTKNSRYSRPQSSYQISPSHQNMRSPMYASPPTADGKRSVSKLSFVGEGGQQEIIDYPSRHCIPNPPRSKEAAVYLKSKKVTKSDQKKSMNYLI